MSGDRLLVRETLDQPLCLSYKLSSSCYLCLPVVAGAFENGKQWLRFGRHRQTLYLLVMIREEDWQAMSYIEGSRMRRHMLHPKKEVISSTSNATRALPRAEPESMRGVAAKHAFCVLPGPWLLKFSRYIGTEVPNEDAAFDAVWKLVQSILDIRDEDTFRICSRRAHKQEHTSNAYEFGGVEKSVGHWPGQRRMISIVLKRRQLLQWLQGMSPSSASKPKGKCSIF